jgi:predicted amidohydrolase YtcJ
VFLTPFISDLDVEAEKGGVLNTPPCIHKGLNTSSAEHSIHADESTRLSDAGSRLTVQRVKIFSDGSLGAETAALRLHNPEEVADVADHKGILYYDTESLRSKIRRAHECGYRLEVHAIGDAAAEQVCAINRTLSFRYQLIYG